MNAHSRVPALDGVRGIAILIVLLDHFGAKVPVLGTAGWAGVELFFVLSGFLITGILLDTREAPRYFGSFYGRRLLRIAPVYLIALVLLLCVFPFTRLAPELPVHRQWILYALLLCNWVRPVEMGGHLWSLAVEEQFYLLWPAVVRKLTQRHLLYCAGIVTLLCPLIRWGLFSAGVAPVLIYRWTITRIDLMMIGALCAAAVRSTVVRSFIAAHRPWLPAICAALFLGNRAWGPYQNPYSPGMITVGYSIFGLAFAALVLYAALGRSRILEFSVFRLFGRYSYGIYVYHLILMRVLDAYKIGPAGAMRPVFLFAAALVAGALSFELIERRALAEKWRFEPWPKARAVRAA